MDSFKHISAKMLGRKVTKRLDNKVTGNRFILVALLLIALSLTGCVTLPDPETTQDFSSHAVAAINATQSVGQTFVSRRSRLNGLDLWLKPAESTWLTVELFHKPEDETPIYSGRVHASEGRTRINLPIQTASAYQTYYLKLSADHGYVDIFGRNEEAYPLGSAFVNDKTVNADLAFRATYDYDRQAVYADIRSLISISGQLVALGLLLFLPGLLFLDFLNWKNELDLGERLAMALGISLAFIPLLMLWTSWVGLKWGSISIWFVAGIFLLILIWRWITNTSFSLPREKQSVSDIDASYAVATENTSKSSPELFKTIAFRDHLSSIVLFSIFALALILRFAMVRDLVAPAWVDSIHHGLIPRLMLDSGGLPESYTPYLPTGADHYHFGYHSSLATFIWLTGLEIHTAMLIFGQVLNALMVFPIYLLTKTLTKNRPAGLTAALIVTAFTLMPAYYTSWGRYTQLAGLLVLPASFALLIKIARARSYKEIDKRVWLLAAITCAGLFLIHYRVSAFLGLLMLAYLLVQISPKQWVSSLAKLLLVILLILVLLVPWFPETFTQLLVPTGIKLSGGQAEFSTVPWNFLKPGLGEVALILAGVGFILGITLLKRFPITVLLWTGFLYILANLGVFTNIPGAGFVNPVSMEITLFAPIAILGGFAVGGTLEWIDKFISGYWQLSPRFVFIALGIWGGILGAQRLLPTLNPTTFLAREVDFPAIQWIDENLPKDEPVLINPAHWGYGLYMGHDGGYWISALSAHPTMPLPVIYGFGETAEIQSVNQTSETVISIGEDPDALWNLMQAENFRYIFTGGRGGVISPQALSQSDLFTVRYNESGTWVFEAITHAP